MAGRRTKRRGVVLLVVLSMLVLFLVIAMMFALVAGQYRRSAEAAVRPEHTREDPRQLTDAAMYQVLRDTNDPYSVMRSHSLLRDIYGDDGFFATVRAANSVGTFQGPPSPPDGTGGQLLDIQVFTPATAPLPSNRPFDLQGNQYTLNATTGYYNGCVLTVLSGGAHAISTRIINYDGQLGLFRVMTFPSADGDPVTVADIPTGTRVLINGRPFNGTGFGYDVTSGKLSAISLLPNRFAYTANLHADGEALAGGADESYDAADFQNMILAAQIPSSADLNTLAAIIPSLHRPALINYHRQNDPSWDPASNNGYRNARRAAILRPMPWDHPNFSGSNPNLAPGPWTGGADNAPGEQGVDDDGDGTRDNISEYGWPGSDDVLRNDQQLLDNITNGPWDVDNDGDGVRDSVWVDLGLPIKRTRDGRTYKPLFAILCVDQDGKFNLNAHGNPWHYMAPPNPVTLARGVSSDTLGRRGQGYGPPEVNMGPLGGTGLFTSTQYQWILQGDSARNIPGRYGASAVPGIAGIDGHAVFNFFEFPNNYYDGTIPVPAQLSAYFNPPDLRGQLAMGLDFRGIPIFEQPAGNLKQDSPYELDLFTPSNDQPYTVAELERILRANDVDAFTLPKRLWTLVDSFSTNPSAAANRRAVTTHSFDLPTPSVLTTPDRRTRFRADTARYPKRRPLHFTDLLRIRLRSRIRTSLASANGWTPPLTAAQEAQVDMAVNTEIRKMVAPEVIRGLRMDVNRPFGNASDDNGNLVVDDHGVAPGADLEANPGVEEKIYSTNIWFDHNNDGLTTNNDPNTPNVNDNEAFLARHLYARHLYVLMMTMMDNNPNVDLDGDGNLEQTADLIRAVAQWAVNVVDFRDADSIMTPFEFDLNPFNGWDVDGIVGTNEGTSDRAIVWGTERPELLITETLAFHDRRTEDTAEGGSGMMDDDYDQRLRPRGSLFVELHNPWAGTSRQSAEFYNGVNINSYWNNGVQLNRRSPGGTPVWRLIITEGGGNPDHWDTAQRPAIERTVYFTDSAGPQQGTTFFTSNSDVSRILPGRYGVIGSAGQKLDDQGRPLDMNNNGVRDFLTTIGRTTMATEGGMLDYSNTRSIVLEPTSDPSVPQVRVYNNQAPSPEPVPPEVLPAVAVAIDQVLDPVSGTARPRSLNVSEPAAGYPPQPGYDPTAADYEGAYNPAIDQPFDEARADSNAVMTDGTTRDYRRAHLQRLANPQLNHDPNTNPYLTIDSMSIDLTAFNGLPGGSSDPNANPGSVEFYSMQRGDSDVAVTPPYRRALWAHEPVGPAKQPSQQEAVPTHNFPYILGHTLGWLSEKYHPRYTGGMGGNAPSSEYIGAPNSDPPAMFPTGDPFPWLTWQNRPFVSAAELLQVPISSSFNLPRDFTMARNVNSYDPGGAPTFGHLLNFFQTTSFTNINGATHFYRALEYLHVPSKFVGTHTFLNPQHFASGEGTEDLHAPFNRLSNYREPGRVNLNTIYDPRVWQGILNGHANWTFDMLVDSRRGYGSGGAGMTPPLGTGTRADEVPTFFSNPFRAAGAGVLVPPLSTGSMERPDSEVGLLRSNSIEASSAPGNTPLFANANSNAHSDTNRNSYFRYETLQRLDSLTTTRSNVYAVWVTVGYFEVEPWPSTVVAPGFPDGYRLGQEVGAATGEIRRHRAFYIIDRTTPVAFQPGENHNVDRAILLRRFIE